jgi:hypothetical protein
MAKNAAKKNLSKETVKKFSIKSLNRQIDSVLKRIQDLPASPGKADLKRKMRAIQYIAYCGSDMSFDLYRARQY